MPFADTSNLHLFTVPSDNRAGRVAYLLSWCSLRDFGALWAKMNSNHAINNLHNTKGGKIYCNIMCLLMYCMLSGNCSPPFLSGTVSLYYTLIARHLTMFVIYVIKIELGLSGNAFPCSDKASCTATGNGHAAY